MKDYHSILEVSSRATPEELKRAFKQKIFQFHPDRNPHNPEVQQKFHDVMEAYAYLSGNRETYRALQQATSTAGVSASFQADQDVFQTLFDLDMRPAKSRPRVLHAHLELSLEEAFRGGSHTVAIKRDDLCPDCEGRGVEAGAKTMTCTYCFGEGEVSNGGEGSLLCPKCKGRGFLSGQACLSCKAHGVISHSFKFQVEVPAKVNSEQILSLPRQGHEWKLGQRGEVQVKVKLKKHPLFSFDRGDVICEVSLGLSEAALGSEVEIPTLAGDKYIKIPAGVQSGQVMRLKGLGLGGDQLIRLWVKTPKAITEHDRRFFQAQAQTKGWWNRVKRLIW